MTALLIVGWVLYLALCCGVAWGGVLLWRLWQYHRFTRLIGGRR